VAFSNMDYDGLGAARGQRSRKGPCASYPTRQKKPSCVTSKSRFRDATYGTAFASFKIECCKEGA